MKLTHLMFDVTTLGFNEKAVITRLACIPFTFEDNTTFEDHLKNGLMVALDVRDQVKTYQRTTDPDTMDWWKRQPEDIKQAVKPTQGDLRLPEALDTLRDFVKQTNYDFKQSYVWSKGSHFDFPKIDDLYKSINQRPPFNLFKIRDTRTMIDCLTGDLNGNYELANGTPKNFVAYNALHECALEITKMKEIYDDLKE